MGSTSSKIVHIDGYGHKYEGEFVDGKFHGKGKITYNDGTFREGIFINNSFLGSNKNISYPIYKVDNTIDVTML